MANVVLAGIKHPGIKLLFDLNNARDVAQANDELIDAEKSLIQLILDVHLPTHSSDDIISIVQKLGGIFTLIDRAYDTEPLIDAATLLMEDFDYEVELLYFANIIKLLAKYLHDLYHNEPLRLELLEKYKELEKLNAHDNKIDAALTPLYKIFSDDIDLRYWYYTFASILINNPDVTVSDREALKAKLIIAVDDMMNQKDFNTYIERELVGIRMLLQLISSDEWIEKLVSDIPYTNIKTVRDFHDKLVYGEDVVFHTPGTIDTTPDEEYYKTMDLGGYEIRALEARSNARPKRATNLSKAYRTYKAKEDQIDSKLQKFVAAGKKLLIGDVRTELIEGKRYSPIKMLKAVLATVGVFSVNPVVGVIALVVKYALKKKTTVAERKKLIMEFETEIEMLDEKIDDAKSNGDTQAKYALMRTQKELKNGLDKIRLGIIADEKAISSGKKLISKG